MGQAYEVVFIDDGSTDRSLNEIKNQCRGQRNFRYVSFYGNYGKSAALQAGFRAATGDAAVTMDADLQDDPAEIPNLLAKLDEGYDVVSGWKKKRYDPFIKKLSSKFFNFVTRLFTRVKLHDFNCGLKAYRRGVIDNVTVYGELHRYIPALAKWNGFPLIAEAVVKHHPRKYGKTKYGPSRFFKGFVDLLTALFITRYVRRPMHLFGFLGALAFVVGVGVNGYLSVIWYQGEPLSNRPLLLFGMLLMIVGVQFFTVGLLGEMFANQFFAEKEYPVKDKNF